MRFDAFAHGRAEIGEVQIHYRIAGDGPPVLLLHGWPQHSLMWHAIAPALAARHRVIMPDQRGAGASTITPGGYDKDTMAGDIAGLLDHLGIGQAAIVGYDLGAGVACAFARRFPERVRRLAVAEFGLAGFGFEQQMTPSPDWTIGSNWHLALFTVPDAAVWLMSGREREMLAWFFGHITYRGQGAVSADHFESYHREVTKPGALRAGVQYYAAVWQDARDNAALKRQPLAMPVLAMGGEASAGPALDALWGPVARNLETYVIPQAGHWIGDENPAPVAERLLQFLTGEGGES
ncbi:MAG: alpha/beta hydrolase [Methylobacteriaceae bacterium]|nr:alpha/beta hydrolase [Methylobacteriaceae bacterium]